MRCFRCFLCAALRSTRVQRAPDLLSLSVPIYPLGALSVDIDSRSQRAVNKQSEGWFPHLVRPTATGHLRSALLYSCYPTITIYT